MTMKFTYLIILALGVFGCTPERNSDYSSERVDHLIASLSDDEKLAQLQGIWLKDLPDGRELSLDSCKKKIPYGIGRFGQFAGSADLENQKL